MHPSSSTYTWQLNIHSILQLASLLPLVHYAPSWGIWCMQRAICYYGYDNSYMLRQTRAIACMYMKRMLMVPGNIWEISLLVTFLWMIIKGYIREKHIIGFALSQIMRVRLIDIDPRDFTIWEYLPARDIVHSMNTLGLTPVPGCSLSVTAHNYLSYCPSCITTVRSGHGIREQAIDHHSCDKSYNLQQLLQDCTLKRVLILKTRKTKSSVHCNLLVEYNIERDEVMTIDASVKNQQTTIALTKLLDPSSTASIRIWVVSSLCPWCPNSAGYHQAYEI